MDPVNVCCSQRSNAGFLLSMLQKITTFCAHQKHKCFCFGIYVCHLLLNQPCGMYRAWTHDDLIKAYYLTFLWVFIVASSILLPLSWNVSHSRVFRTDYGCVEKTLISLITMHWNSNWVIKYVLIKVACNFPMHLPHMHLLYMVVCTTFYWEKNPKMMHN